MTPFAERIRQSFEDMKRAVGDRQPSDLSPMEMPLRGHSWESIAELPKDTFNSVELDAVYAAVVRSYQRGQRSLWAPLLLEMLAPAILQKLDTLFSDVPEADAEDIEQQLVLEVLRWASRLRTPDDLRFVDGTILLRATERTARWLRRTRRRQPEALAAHPGLEYDYRRAELDELNDICGGSVRREDVVLLYRFDIWHEPVERLAREQGVPPATMLWRFWRTRQRLRTLLASQRPSRRSAA
jgi:hypothetical protein